EIERPSKLGPGTQVQDLRHFRDLHGEELAEDRADVDAGKKIARAAGSPGRAGVVAELGVVKREIHERGHRHRPAFANHVSDMRSTISNRQSSMSSIVNRQWPMVSLS